MAGPVRLFLSWCHDDRRAKEALLSRLMPMLTVQRGLSVDWWEDSHLATGEKWRRAILARLADCDYGVLLLSPGFFASGFIVTEELPWFVGPAATKGALPVMLAPVMLDGTWELHGVDAHQIFTLDGDAFADTGEPRRTRFARELAGEIRRRVTGSQPWRRVP